MTPKNKVKIVNSLRKFGDNKFAILVKMAYNSGMLNGTNNGASQKENDMAMDNLKIAVTINVDASDLSPKDWSMGFPTSHDMIEAQQELAMTLNCIVNRVVWHQDGKMAEVSLAVNGYLDAHLPLARLAWANDASRHNGLAAVLRAIDAAVKAAF